MTSNVIPLTPTIEPSEPRAQPSGPSSTNAVPETVTIESAKPEDLPALEVLWERMYAYQRSCGMMGRIPDEATVLWGKGVERMMRSSLSVILVARKEGRIVGFLEGVVSAGPAYLGGESVGVIRHLYVAEEARRQGVARRLVDQAVERFRSRGAGGVELQVVRGNDLGVKFWQALGWELQLLQMRREL
jgi:ribosomal protein S18 acetylase RimI-like enzyme